MILFNLFWVFTKISLFAVGGAYSFLPIMEKEIVQRYSWLTKEEFLDVLAMVKIFPGAISIKYATYTGYKMAHTPGVIAANLGNFLCPALLIILATSVYAKYRDAPVVKAAFDMIQLAIFAMLIAIAFQLVGPGRLLHMRSFVIAISAFLLFTFANVHPAIIIVLAGLLGVFWK